jgi:ParB family chromosome partitioning protein
MAQESKGTGHEQVINMRISLIEPNRSQPRKYFDDSAISELADSVRQFGIIQPLLVQKKDDYYEIIAGERRWRAANKAGLKEIPVIVKNFSNQEAVEVSLIENIQREDLNPIEEAKAYERLVKEYGLSQEAVAGRVSKSRTSITNSMRLLKLDQNVQQMVETGELSEGHARAILGLPDQAAQKELANKVIEERLSVRQTEKLVRDTVHPRKAAKEKKSNPEHEAILMDLAERLKTHLGTKVNIKSAGANGGKIEIEYYSYEELDRLFDLLTSDIKY